MSEFRVLSEVVQGSDDEGSFDLGDRPLTPRPLTPQDEETVDELHNMCKHLASGQEDAARNAQPRTPSKDPNAPRGCRGSDTAGACRRLFSPETPEEWLDMMKVMGDSFAKTFAAQADAKKEVNALKQQVEKHEKRIAVLEGYLERLYRLEDAIRSKRRAEEATEHGPSKRPVPSAP